MRRYLLAICLTACASPAADDITQELSPSCQEATSHQDLAWIQANVFDKSCAFASCHGSPTTPAGGLSLVSGRSRDALVGIASTQQPSWKRIVAGDASRSYLLVALGYQAGPLPESGTMPAGQAPLCAEKLEAVERWIVAGALP